MYSKKSAGINGTGRFGLHLLQYWIENYHSSQFEIDYVNDDSISLEELARIVEQDAHLRLRNYLSFSDNHILVQSKDINKTIFYTNQVFRDIEWAGKPDVFLECSGKQTQRKDWSCVITGETQKVLVSATSWTANQMIVYGHNHEDAEDSSAVLSYGSCTINAYVPLANKIEDAFGVVDSDVNVVHNVPLHKLSSFNTLERRECTLETAGPHLLPFLNSENFRVNYTLVPFAGVSLIEYRFRLKISPNTSDFIEWFNQLIENDKYRLYGIKSNDNGPEEHKFTTNSAVFLKPSIKILGDNLYLSAYFDNENSANRYFDLVNHIAKKKDVIHA